MHRVLALLLAAAAAAPAPLHAAEPALTTPPKELAAALECPQALNRATRAPVLLIPGTNLEPDPNFDWNYEPALTAEGFAWCAVTLPRFGMHDIQIAAEYVVAAIRRIYAESGRRVSIVGFSQGGMIGRWALRFWPDTRGMLEDLVGLAPSNHGTLTARPACSSECAPAYWQQRDDSRFIAALNDGPETFAGIDYTVVYTQRDEVVTPNADEQTGSSSLRTGAGRVENTAIQEICPTDNAEHLVLGSYDPVGWALVLDALAHDGTADPDRIGPAVCAQQFMPGVDPAAFPENWARYTAALGEGARQADQTSEEPPLRCYVTRTCPPEPACVTRRRFTLPLAKALRRATVTVDGRRAPVRRRRGRLIAVIDLRRRAPGVAVVKIRGTRRDGTRLRRTRRYRVCD